MSDRPATTLSRRAARVALAAILLAGLAPQLWWITRGRETLVAQALYEDAFYYFQNARNVARGRGSVSAGGIPNNGYHPMWMLVSAGAFRLAGGRDLAAIRGILAFSVLLSMAAALVAYRAARALGCGRGAALLGAGALHLNPYMLDLSVSGLEAALNALLIAAVVWWTARSRQRRPRWGGWGVPVDQSTPHRRLPIAAS